MTATVVLCATAVTADVYRLMDKQDNICHSVSTITCYSIMWP